MPVLPYVKLKKELDPVLGANMATVLRFGAAGAALGAGSAATVRFLKLTEELKRDKQRRNEEDTDEEGVVVKLRKQSSNKHGGINVALADSYERTMPLHNLQLREANGTFGPKVASASWQTLLASGIAATGGALAGSALINELAAKRRHKVLDDELEARIKEYEELLLMDKQANAMDNTFSISSFVLGVPAAAALLSMGATGWLTKKILDERYKSSRPIIPKRVVVSLYNKPNKPVNEIPVDQLLTKEDEEEIEKQSSCLAPVDFNVMDSMLSVYLDVCSGSSDVLSTKVAQDAMDEAGLNAPDLYKMATEVSGAQRLRSVLEANPKVMDAFKVAGMEKHPILKHMTWARNIPGVKQLGDNKVLDTISSVFKPTTPVKPTTY